MHRELSAHLCNRVAWLNSASTHFEPSQAHLSHEDGLEEREGGVDMLSEGPTDAQVARFQSIRGSPSDAWESRRESNPRAQTNRRMVGE